MPLIRKDWAHEDRWSLHTFAQKHFALENARRVALVRAVKETVAESPDEKAKKRIVQIVAEAGSGGITRNELTRKTQFIRSMASN